MKFAIKLTVTIALLMAGPAFSETLREKVLKDAVISAGLVRAVETHVPSSEAMALIGKELFESKLLSLDKDTACASCHLDQFGSADGIPNALGTQANGVGLERVSQGGDIIPRNTLPFWGRGGLGFDIFFWDGKVDNVDGKIQSQFIGKEPSTDPLVVAVHIPPVEIGEMVTDTRENEARQIEEVESATVIYELLAERIRKDPKLGSALAEARALPVEQITFLDAAEAIAAFIRMNFQLKPTKLHKFVFDGGMLSDEELSGGLLFYGRGRCSACHNGPYFSDFKFHAVPFPQLGFGKNGFGVDYGRFNVTLDYNDRYLFRTPPLFNVSKTSPYSHSGSVVGLSDAIRAHVDPLIYYDPDTMSLRERADFYERLTLWANTPLKGIILDNEEIEEITAFLKTLEYSSTHKVRIVD